MTEGGLFTPQNIRRMRKLAEQRRLAKEFPAAKGSANPR
jgi:hypothetical protein